MTTQLDESRLQMGAEGMHLGLPKDRAEIIKQIDQLEDSIIAMQSLDDLGSDEENDRAWNDMKALQKAQDALKKSLKETKKDG